jgi:hypothetical protein
VLYALGRLPVRGLGPRLRRGGTWVRIFLTDDLRVRESLLVDLRLINHIGNLLNIRPKMCAAKMF